MEHIKSHLHQLILPTTPTMGIMAITIITIRHIFITTTGLIMTPALIKNVLIAVSMGSAKIRRLAKVW